VSTITIYIPKENGDLSYVADVEDEDRPDMALDAVLDELPRIASRSDTFVALVDGFDGGTSVTLTLADSDVVERRPKRSIAMTNGAVVEADEDDTPMPTPKRRPGRPRKAAAATAAAAAPVKRGPGRPRKNPLPDAAPAPRGRKPAAKKASGRKTPFTRNAKSDD